jgi:hypothetical protein
MAGAGMGPGRRRRCWWNRVGSGTVGGFRETWEDRGWKKAKRKQTVGASSGEVNYCSNLYSSLDLNSKIASSGRDESVFAFFCADPVVGLGAAVSPWGTPPERRHPCHTDSPVHRCSVYHRRRRRHVRLLPVVRVLFLPTQRMGRIMCAACLLPLLSVHDSNDWCRGEEGIVVAGGF